jgi:hypothetical protein
MTRQLRAVEALPETQAATLLPGLADAGASVDEADAPGDALAERAPGA